METFGQLLIEQCGFLKHCFVLFEDLGQNKASLARILQLSAISGLILGSK
jgi:hypothetical protein